MVAIAHRAGRWSLGWAVSLLIGVGGCAGPGDVHPPPDGGGTEPAAGPSQEVRVGQDVKVHLASGVVVPGRVLACDAGRIVVAPRDRPVGSVTYEAEEIARIQVVADRDAAIQAALGVGILALVVVGVLIKDAVAW